MHREGRWLMKVRSAQGQSPFGSVNTDMLSSTLMLKSTRMLLLVLSDMLEVAMREVEGVA